MPIYDIYDDEHGHMYSVISKEYNTHLVKSASQEPKHFAWREEKKFALDTPDDIALSYLYFQKTASDVPEEVRYDIKTKLEKAASFHNLNWNHFHKEPVKVAEINPDQFALSIPLNKIPPTMKTKVANYIYNNHFSMYPLNTEENVKSANYMFPQGLDDFPQFKPLVAQKIAEAIGDVEKLKPQVAEWLPFSKTAMLEELDTRATVSGNSMFSDIAREFSTLEDTLETRAYMYKKMKTASTIQPEDARHSFQPPEKFLSGWKEDIVVKRDFKINNRSYPENLFKSKAASLAEYYPEIKSLCKKPVDLQDYLESLDNVDLDIIEGILRHE